MSSSADGAGSGPAARVVVLGDALIDEFRDADGSADYVGGALYGQRKNQPANIPTILQDIASGDQVGSSPPP